MDDITQERRLMGLIPLPICDRFLSAVHITQMIIGDGDVYVDDSIPGERSSQNVPTLSPT